VLNRLLCAAGWIVEVGNEALVSVCFVAVVVVECVNVILLLIRLLCVAGLIVVEVGKDALVSIVAVVVFVVVECRTVELVLTIY